MLVELGHMCSIYYHLVSLNKNLYVNQYMDVMSFLPSLQGHYFIYGWPAGRVLDISKLQLTQPS